MPEAKKNAKCCKVETACTLHRLLMFVYHAVCSRKTRGNSLWVVTIEKNYRKVGKSCVNANVLENLHVNESLFFIR